jgi:D-alanyl-D-alanine endopeptidase (penicillin-binding protein 7)
MTPDDLVAEMNATARELGLSRTHFTDPTGLNGNWSTAREMAMAMSAILHDPVLAEVLATRFTTIATVATRPRALYYANTNRILHNDHWHVLGGKTGFTDEAQYCLVTAIEVNRRRLAFVLLGARGELTRYADFNRIAGWMGLGQGHGEPGPVMANTAGAPDDGVPAQKADDAR